MKFAATLSLLSTLLVSVNCRAIDLSLRQDAYPANFKPNFGDEYSVTIQKPISEVFQVLGTNEGLEKHILLSSIASDFQSLNKDSVTVQGNLEDNFVRTQPAAAEGEGLPRQGFKYKETIKIIPGLSFTDIPVNLQGTFTWDEARKISLYETSSDSSITVKKVRRFEEVDGGAATKVSEKIDGQCPFLEQPLVQLTAAKAHKEQMDLYHTLFE
ncbi:hypothetical protein DL96DRAFT_1305692 [Flagelloscypha sp. PMI_526]|nr:hypothetical protein DL96DRAFT_1305692 [Flagelloscypha sp. PMI_526]